MKESEIQTLICQYLEMKKYLFWRSNNTPVAQKKVDGSWFFRAMGKYAMKGIPDILVIMPPNGTLVGIECKQKGKYQTKEQKEFQKRLEKAGGVYIVARDLKDVENIL